MNPLPERQDPRRLEAVISAQEFSSLYSTSPWKREFINSFFKMLGRRFGTELLFRIPENLRSLHPAVFKDLGVIEKLRNLGLLEHVGFSPNPPDEPPMFYAYAKSKESGSGAHFSDPERALWSALGEMVERSLWFGSAEWYEGKVKIASYKELSGEKLDPRALAGFSEEQKLADPMLQVAEESRFGWILAEEWIIGGHAWIPLQLLSAEYSAKHQKSPKRPKNEEPLLRSNVTTGLASSSHNLEEAILYGALEVIERDAFMITWLNRLSPPRLDQEDLARQSAELRAIFASFSRYHLRAEFLLLPTDFPFFIVAATISDETGKGAAFSLGAKAHWNLEQAVLGALSEAMSVRLSMKNTYENPVNMDSLGRKERLLYWAKPENASRLGFLRGGEIIQAELVTKTSDTKAEFKHLCDAFKKKGYPMYAAEISSKASLKVGFRSAYVCVPALQPLHLDERAPAFGGERLTRVPLSLGYAPAPHINIEPHPFP